MAFVLAESTPKPSTLRKKIDLKELHTKEPNFKDNDKNLYYVFQEDKFIKTILFLH